MIHYIYRLLIWLLYSLKLLRFKTKKIPMCIKDHKVRFKRNHNNVIRNIITQNFKCAKITLIRWNDLIFK